MQNKKMENSIRSLVTLYLVVIGAALSVAVTGVINPTDGLAAATPTSVCLFVAFLATLFPFVHGAVRHLDDAYLENATDQVKDGVLVFDFVLLFFHALAFLVLSMLLKKPNHFAWGLAAILAIDVVWGLFTHYGASSVRVGSAESKWTTINFVSLALLIIYLVLNDVNLGQVSDPIKLAVPVMFVAILRTIADYVWCRSFYFPKDQPTPIH